MSLSERERLERMPLEYDVVIRRRGEIVFRTIARGSLDQVLDDVYRLAGAVAGESCEYTRRAQVTPAPPIDGPKWWHERAFRPIERGTAYELKLTTPPHRAGVAVHVPTLEELTR